MVAWISAQGGGKNGVAQGGFAARHAWVGLVNGWVDGWNRQVGMCWGACRASDQDMTLTAAHSSPAMWQLSRPQHTRIADMFACLCCCRCCCHRYAEANGLGFEKSS